MGRVERVTKRVKDKAFVIVKRSTGVLVTISIIDNKKRYKEKKPTLIFVSNMFSFHP